MFIIKCGAIGPLFLRPKQEQNKLILQFPQGKQTTELQLQVLTDPFWSLIRCRRGA